MVFLLDAIDHIIAKIKYLVENWYVEDSDQYIK